MPIKGHIQSSALISEQPAQLFHTQGCWHILYQCMQDAIDIILALLHNSKIA